MNEEKPMSEHVLSTSDMAVSKKRHAWGLFMIIAPFPGLFVVLIMYSIVSFFALQATVPGGDNPIVFKVLNIFLALLGLLCIIGIIVGIPLGIYLLIKKTVPAGSEKAIK